MDYIANRKKWAEALRSGKYSQGRGKLHITFYDTNTFCCLGVACDIFKDELGLVVRPNQYSKTILYNSNDAYLPDHLANYLGIGINVQQQLTRMNDQGSSFDEISSVIDRFPNEYIK